MERKLHILHLEDSRNDAELIRKHWRTEGSIARSCSLRKKAEEERERIVRELKEALARVTAGTRRNSHGMCPDCLGKAFEEVKQLKQRE